jgi:hypothetical protein
LSQAPALHPSLLSKGDATLKSTDSIGGLPGLDALNVFRCAGEQKRESDAPAGTSFPLGLNVYKNNEVAPVTKPGQM